MKEYKILKKLPFFLMGHTVSQEELEMQFTKEAIENLITSEFIAKKETIIPKNLRVFKYGIKLEVSTPSGVEATTDIIQALEELLDKIFEQSLYHEKVFDTIKSENIFEKESEGELLKTQVEGIAEELGILPIRTDISIPTKDSSFYKKWKEKIIENTGANNPNLSEEEKQSLLKRYPTILKGCFKAEDKKEDKKEDNLSTKTLVVTAGEVVKAAQVQGKLYQCYFATLKNSCPDWKCDWKDNRVKWCLRFFMDHIIIDSTYFYKGLFPFPTKELAQTFLDTHREDLEIYKPLM